MIIYPAIDIQDGKCVRLEKGDFNKVTEFNSDIVAQAKIFADAGFKWLHVVDLDGAKLGRPVNHHYLAEIVKETGLKVQVGGGIRSLDAIEDLVNSGVERVILGTVAIKDKALLKEACQKFPGRIAVGVDTKGNKVAVGGWLEETDVYVFDLIEELEKIGVAAVIYTDISRDGLLSGVDALGTKEIAKHIKIPVIASGGVADVSDIEKIVAIQEHGMDGIIIGRAFYDQKIPFAKALKYQTN